MKYKRSDGTLVVGVLGGIGPDATQEFYRKLCKKLRDVGTIKKNSDYPQVVINSIPAPELINDEITEEELHPYISGVIQLDRFGVDIIAMVCNTIHLYHDQLQQVVRTPIIDLRTEVQERLQRDDIRKISVVGSPSTIKRGLYDFDGVETVKPNDNEITELSDAIYDFNRGYNRDQQKRKTEEIVKKYIDNGAEVVILGCTEFAVMLEETDLPTVNTIDILVDSIIAKRGVTEQ